jgi:alginate O-acetyltransferase complex protein AlgI
VLFNTSVFAVFLFVTFTAFWAVPKRWLRELVLLLASVVFYGFWDYRFLALVAYVILVTYVAGRWVHRGGRVARTAWPLACVLLLGQLAVFKYTNFAIESVAGLLGWVGVEVDAPRFDILLPAGISFYTFQALSYVSDLHTGRLPTAHGPLRVALYILFFPHLVAGPIVRADLFFPKLDAGLRLDGRNVLVGLKLIAIGLIYKSIFADRISPLIDPVFAKPNIYDIESRVWAIVGFYGQIYFDFAGYSTMAIGLSRLFGVTLPKNFDFPYRARSITEFWRRWHISLSTWLRDYLYIPLGGSRGGRWLTHRNLMLTMLLGGLWHGASINFVIWGGLHGLALVVHKEFSERFPSERGGKLVQSLRGGFGWALTQLFVLLLWVPFRASDLETTQVFVEALLGRGEAGTKHLEGALWLLVVPVLVDQAIVGSRRVPRLAVPRLAWAWAALIGFLLALTLPFTHLEVVSFIYFQF